MLISVRTVGQETELLSFLKKKKNPEVFTGLIWFSFMNRSGLLPPFPSL